MGIHKIERVANNRLWLIAQISIISLLLVLYGWTVFEPFAGDALMHMMDDTKIKNIHDFLRPLYSSSNPAYIEHYRLPIFHRPVFNEWYIYAVKHIFGVKSIWLRAVTLLLLIISTWSFLGIMRRMGFHPLAATVGAAWFAFAPALFFGLYEYGISFSELLVFFGILSLSSLQAYIGHKEGLRGATYLSLTLLFTFLIVFTKESAALWPFLMIGAILLFEGFRHGDTAIESQLDMGFVQQHLGYLRKNWLLAACLPLITVAYFVTRYIKLGGLTQIAANIEQPVALGDSLIKLYTYVLMALEVPGGALPNYLSISIQNMPVGEIAIRLVLFLSAVTALWAMGRRSKSMTIFSIVASLLMFLPIIKVSRNSPYYGDLMTIPVALAIGFGFDAISRKWNGKPFRVWALAVTALTVLAALLFEYGNVRNMDLWLARAQGFGRAEVADFSAAEGSDKADQFVGTSGMYYPESRWALSHGGVGWGLYANFNVDKTRLIPKSDEIKRHANAMFIDFMPDYPLHRVAPYPLSARGKMIFAYFPEGFARVPLAPSGDRVALNGAKVVRLSCQNAFVKPFDLIFLSPGINELHRNVVEEINLGANPKSQVIEFVVPGSATSVRLPTDTVACASPSLEGYVATSVKPLHFSKVLNRSADFSTPSDWRGAFQAAKEGGVIVGPGAENTNVLTQLVAVVPSTRYKLVARAAAGVGPMAVGRLQINWVDKNKDFLSTSSRTISVDATARDYEVEVTSPADVTMARLYVSPHGPHDVLRFESMRLLGAEASD
ncbi:hypothetical protein [Paraburkholderia hayleyella]|uniref:hypothetical protein n=1 Tax=Paraburkholderia hayleyella TaxID=2152889 RepID=UPI001292040E|nr:hypothetical protein [Paraburkholderia hayleyella]